MVRPPNRAASHNDHERHDYGSLRTKVEGLEGSFARLSEQTTGQIEGIRGDLSVAIEGVRKDQLRQSDDLKLQLISLAKDIREQANSGRTRWLPLLGTVASMGALILAIITVVGSMALSPVSLSLAEIKQDARDARWATEKSVLKLDGEKWSKDAQGEFERRIDDKLAERKADYQRTVDGIYADIRSIRDNLVTRAENAAHWDEIAGRINAISVRLNELQHEFGANFTIGDAVKDMQTQIRELRTQGQGATVTPVTPLVPLSPSPK